MIFLHDSLKSDHFKGDKKLELLNKGVITTAQFVNLIEPKDDYIMIGPAIVAKTAIKEFLTEWKMHQLNIDAATASTRQMSQDEIIVMVPKLIEVFPEVSPFFNEMNNQLKVATCPKCVKNRYIGYIIGKIKDLKDDGRDISKVSTEVDRIMNQFFPVNDPISQSQTFSEYDIEWMKPERLLGLGKDLVQNLTHCFDCTIKHLGRAKILYEEFVTGYPDHGKMMFNELEKGNSALEDAYLIYLDSMAQLDMASCELVGNLLDLPDGWQVEMIELANKIRAERLLFQEDLTKVPNFDALRLEVKKLQIKTNNALNENKEETK